MLKKEADRRLSQAERKEVFLALVLAQDAGMNPLQSRKETAERRPGQANRRRVAFVGADAAGILLRRYFTVAYNSPPWCKGAWSTSLVRTRQGIR